MWAGANRRAEIVSSTDLVMIPLNRNRTEGRMDRASARNTLLFRKQTIQTSQYSPTSRASTTR